MVGGGRNEEGRGGRKRGEFVLCCSFSLFLSLVRLSCSEPPRSLLSSFTFPLVVERVRGLPRVPRLDRDIPENALAEGRSRGVAGVGFGFRPVAPEGQEVPARPAARLGVGGDDV